MKIHLRDRSRYEIDTQLSFLNTNPRQKVSDVAAQNRPVAKSVGLISISDAYNTDLGKVANRSKHFPAIVSREKLNPTEANKIRQVIDAEMVSFRHALNTIESNKSILKQSDEIVTTLTPCKKPLRVSFSDTSLVAKNRSIEGKYKYDFCDNSSRRNFSRLQSLPNIEYRKDPNIITTRSPKRNNDRKIPKSRTPDIERCENHRYKKCLYYDAKNPLSRTQSRNGVCDSSRRYSDSYILVKQTLKSQVSRSPAKITTDISPYVETLPKRLNHGSGSFSSEKPFFKEKDFKTNRNKEMPAFIVTQTTHKLLKRRESLSNIIDSYKNIEKPDETTERLDMGRTRVIKEGELPKISSQYLMQKVS